MTTSRLTWINLLGNNGLRGYADPPALIPGKPL